MARPRHKEARYIIREKKIDAFTIRRKRVKLTPDVCNICGTGICAINKLPPFETLEATAKAAVLATLKSHKDLYHTDGDRVIVTESQMPTQWLSNEQGQQTNTNFEIARGGGGLAVKKRPASLDEVT